MMNEENKKTEVNTEVKKTDVKNRKFDKKRPRNNLLYKCK